MKRSFVKLVGFGAMIGIAVIGMEGVAPAALAKSPTAKKKPAKAAAVAPGTQMEARPTIPKDATLSADGFYHFTDKQGKKWLYQSTPFGVVKSEEKAAAAPAPPMPDPTRATESGDTVRFERSSPFGVTHWEKKKTDLTEDEKKIVESQKAKPE